METVLRRAGPHARLRAVEPRSARLSVAEGIAAPDGRDDVDLLPPMEARRGQTLARNALPRVCDWMRSTTAGLGTIDFNAGEMYLAYTHQEAPYPTSTALSGGISEVQRSLRLFERAPATE